MSCSEDSEGSLRVPSLHAPFLCQVCCPNSDYFDSAGWQSCKVATVQGGNGGRNEKETLMSHHGEIHVLPQQKGQQTVRVVVKTQKPCLGRLICAFLHVQYALSSPVPVDKSRHKQRIYTYMPVEAKMQNFTFKPKSAPLAWYRCEIKNLYLCPQLDFRTPPGFDRTRNAEIGNKDIKFKHLEEAFTSEHWLVRIYKVKKLDNREALDHKPRNVGNKQKYTSKKVQHTQRRPFGRQRR